MSVEISNYIGAKIFIGGDITMFTDSVPDINAEKKKITFSEVHMKDAFLGKYLGEDFMIELWESDCDEPAVYLYDSGIVKFGMIDLHEVNGERIVTITDMSFEYGWGNDIKGRIEDTFVD
jgi:hypothetical protein